MKEAERLQLTPKEIERLAGIFRMEVTPAETVKFAEQLNDMMQYAEAMTAVATEGVPPTTNLFPVRDGLREDEVRPSLPLALVMANGPETEENSFRVPKIII